MKIGLDAVPKPLMEVLAQLPDSYLVGGCVRDLLLGLKPSDYDTEVFGVTYKGLQKKLEKFGNAELVGSSFGTLKLWRPGEKKEYDFALPRREIKRDRGHKGFEVIHHSDITMRDAAIRRDFTMNALYLDPRTGEVIDHFNGITDLQQGKLRHVSDAFREDPLRVLRGMRFISRFDLTADPETVELCRSIKDTFKELPKPRLWGEWVRWALQSVRPSSGLKFLQETEWLKHFPEMAGLVGVPQDPSHHPEGDAFTHTCHVCDALAETPEWQQVPAERKAALMFAAVSHDFGKAVSTVIENGRIISHGHEETGLPLAESFLSSIDAPNEIREVVVPLVRYHMVRNPKPDDRWIRRMAIKVAPATLQELATLITADHFGRPPKPRIVPVEAAKMRERAQELKVDQQAPKPMLQGRHLIARGMKPGSRMGEVLKAAFEAQINGEFADEQGAGKWLDAQLQPQPSTKHPNEIS
jgi:tRNA nucleotidyltransferase (CCA-adding enzyme)